MNLDDGNKSYFPGSKNYSALGFNGALAYSNWIKPLTPAMDAAMTSKDVNGLSDESTVDGSHAQVGA